MSDIEQKALALLGEVSPYKCEKVDHAHHAYLCAALRLSVERHEAAEHELADCKQELADFRQEVSDVVTSLCNTLLMGSDHSQVCEMLSRRFIIPKPDPLVEAAESTGVYATDVKDLAEEIRAAAKHLAEEMRVGLEALGVKIGKKWH